MKGWGYSMFLCVTLRNSASSAVKYDKYISCGVMMKKQSVSKIHMFNEGGLTQYTFKVMFRIVAMGEPINPLAFAKGLIGRKLQTKNTGSFSDESNKKTIGC